MKVRELLETFDDMYTHIKIFDRSENCMSDCYNKSDAISRFGYFTVRKWRMECGYLIVTIQSQF